MNFLSSSPKTKVYLSVTPGIGIEMIQLDLSNGKVANYSVRDLAYDEQQKQIVDKDAFKNAVMEMFEETGISPKSNVVINMPVVSFGQIRDLSLLLPNDSITGAVENTVEEREYIFKRQEPVVSWIPAPALSPSADGKESRTVLYTAIQKSTIDMLQRTMEEIGATLVGVENSLSSTFRALEYLGLTTDQMQPNMTWNLLIINSTGYTIVSMSGKNVVDYYEEPLAVKSFEGEEIYDAIVQSAKIALTSYPANYLYVISNTDQVSAELILSKLKPTNSADFIENNLLKKQDLPIDVNLNVVPTYLSKISLQVIGCALCDVSNFPLKFSFIDVESTGEASCIIPIGEHEIVVTQKQAFVLVGIIAAILLGFVFILSFAVIPGMNNSKEAKNKEYTEKITQLSAEAEKINQTPDPSANFDYRRQVETGIKDNRAKLMNYTAAGETIPENVWLTYFMTQGNGLVDIKGGSTDVSAIYTYFKNMRDSLIGSNLKLQKLEMDSNSIDAAVVDAGSNYTFEITNMTEDQLKNLMNPNAVDAMNKQNGQAKANNNQSQPPVAPPSQPVSDENNNGLLSDKPIQGR